MEPGTLGLEGRDLTTALTPPPVCVLDIVVGLGWEEWQGLGRKSKGIEQGRNSRTVGSS